jgi:hypothetical protein
MLSMDQIKTWPSLADQTNDSSPEQACYCFQKWDLQAGSLHIRTRRPRNMAISWYGRTATSWKWTHGYPIERMRAPLCRVLISNTPFDITFRAWRSAVKTYDRTSCKNLHSCSATWVFSGEKTWIVQLAVRRILGVRAEAVHRGVRKKLTLRIDLRYAHKDVERNPFLTFSVGSGEKEEDRRISSLGHSMEKRWDWRESKCFDKRD